MVTFINNSDTAIVVIHEIYGINQHITKMCEKLLAQGNDIFCPNLLNLNTSFHYDQGDLAYSNFMEHIGFEQAANQIISLLREIRNRYRFVFILGFSIGATIGWLCSREQRICDAVIGFYGSRIRDYLDLEPQCPTLLFFPSEEKSFKVANLVKPLREKNLVWAKIYPGKHGFADQFSKEYCEESAKKAYQDMDFFIKLLLSGNGPFYKVSL